VRSGDPAVMRVSRKSWPPPIIAGARLGWPIGKDSPRPTRPQPALATVQEIAGRFSFAARSSNLASRSEGRRWHSRRGN